MSDIYIDIVEWLREMQDEYEGSGTVIDYCGHYKAAADRILALEKELQEAEVNCLAWTERIEAQERTEAGFDWRAAYHNEHLDLCAVEGRNYVLEKALREIWTLRDGMDVIHAKVIAHKALGGE